MAAKGRFHRLDNAARSRRIENVVKVLLVILIGAAGFVGGRKWPARKVVREDVRVTSEEGPAVEGSTEAIPESAEEVLAGIQAALAAKQWDEAADLAARAAGQVEDEGDRAEIWNLGGVAEVQRGQNPEAVACFLKAIKLRSKNPAYYFNWAEALRAEGQPEAALVPMRHAVALNPKSLPVKVKWTLLLIQAGRGADVAKAIEAETSDGKPLPLELGFAKVALLRAGDRASEANALITELQTKLPAEVFRACMNDPMLVERTTVGNEARAKVRLPEPQR